MQNKILTDRGVYNINIPVTRKSSTGEVYIVCPVCDPERDKHKGEAKLAINIDKFPHPWRCNHCGRSGYIVDEDSIEKMRIKPVIKNIPYYDIPTHIIDWFLNERKVSIPTLRKLKIVVSKEAIYQKRNDNPELIGKVVSREAINFRYYREGMLINIKYRDRNKNFKLLAGATNIFYNIDSIKKSSKAIIVEGEIDVASYVEAGIDYVISVPNGVTITEKEKNDYEQTGEMVIESAINLSYLDVCMDDLDHIEHFILATDDDPPGIKLREELSRRLGKDKCSYISFGDYKRPDGKPCNDPNDVLIHHGKAILASTIDSALSYPIDGVTQAIQYIEKVKNVYLYGEDAGQSTGYISLDPYFRWMKGWTYVFNGYPQNGKSYLLFNFLALSSVLYDYKWGLYCPENYPPWRIINTFAEILMGDTTNISVSNRMPLQELESVVKTHINNHFYFVDNETGYKPSELRVIKKRMVQQYGINGFLIDPWKNLTHNYKVNIDEYLREELNAEVRIGLKNDLINIICHHPPTPLRDKNKEYKAPSAFDLIGGQIWYATVYGMVCINRVDNTSLNNTLTEIHVQKQKEQKLAGELTERDNPVLLKFEKRTGRFLEKISDTDGDGSYTRYPISDYFDSTKQLKFDSF